MSGQTHAGGEHALVPGMSVKYTQGPAAGPPWAPPGDCAGMGTLGPAVLPGATLAPGLQTPPCQP